MRKARFLFIATVWAASLVGVGLWVQGGHRLWPTESLLAAQTLGDGGVSPQGQLPTAFGTPVGPVLTGDNIGFQQIAEPPDRDGKVAVRMMIKVNGEWHEAVRPVVVVR
jgi:hypothetical protein